MVLLRHQQLILFVSFFYSDLTRLILCCVVLCCVPALIVWHRIVLPLKCIYLICIKRQLRVPKNSYNSMTARGRENEKSTKSAFWIFNFKRAHIRIAPSHRLCQILWVSCVFGECNASLPCIRPSIMNKCIMIIWPPAMPYALFDYPSTLKLNTPVLKVVRARP